MGRVEDESAAIERGESKRVLERGPPGRKALEVHEEVLIEALDRDRIHPSAYETAFWWKYVALFSQDVGKKKDLKNPAGFVEFVLRDYLSALPRVGDQETAIAGLAGASDLKERVGMMVKPGDAVYPIFVQVQASTANAAAAQQARDIIQAVQPVQAQSLGASALKAKSLAQDLIRLDDEAFSPITNWEQLLTASGDLPANLRSEVHVAFVHDPETIRTVTRFLPNPQLVDPALAAALHPVVARYLATLINNGAHIIGAHEVDIDGVNDAIFAEVLRAFDQYFDHPSGKHPNAETVTQ